MVWLATILKIVLKNTESASRYVLWKERKLPYSTNEGQTTSSEHRARSSIIHGSSGTCSLGIKGDIHTAADNSQYRHGMLDGVGSKASSTENTPACTPLVIEPISKGAIARLFAGLAKSPAETIYKEPHNPPSLSHGPGQQHVQHLYDTAHGGQYGTCLPANKTYGSF